MDVLNSVCLDRRLWNGKKIGIGCNGRVGTLLIEIVKRERAREIDSEEDRQTEIKRDQKTEIQTDGPTEIHKYRQTNRDIDRLTYREQTDR